MMQVYFFFFQEGGMIFFFFQEGACAKPLQAYLECCDLNTVTYYINL